MLSETDLKLVLGAIDKEKCIILLGPELNNIASVERKEKALANHLLSQGIKLGYYEDDGLYLFDKPTSLLRLSMNLKEYYDNEPIPPIYEKIAGIPAHLFISITPDLYLQKAFNNLNYDYNISIYNKTENPDDIDAPNKETPLLYYLFGCYDKLDSLVLTHDDLFNFLVAILHKHELPTELNNLIQNAQNLVFLGFRFDHWYVKILLRLLSHRVKQIHDQYEIEQYALSETTNPDTKAFYINEFRMTFFEGSIADLVDQLYEAFKQRNKLRQSPGIPVVPIKELEDCIRKGDLETVFICFKKFSIKKFPGYSKLELDKKIIHQSGRYEHLKDDNNRGLLTPDRYTAERNTIQLAVLNIIQEIKALPGIS